MTETVVFAKNRRAAIDIKSGPGGKVAFELLVQNLLDPGKTDRACAVLTRDELIEVRDALNTILDV